MYQLLGVMKVTKLGAGVGGMRQLSADCWQHNSERTHTSKKVRAGVNCAHDGVNADNEPIVVHSCNILQHTQGWYQGCSMSALTRRTPASWNLSSWARTRASFRYIRSASAPHLSTHSWVADSS